MYALDFEYLATQRRASLFAEDCALFKKQLLASFQDRHIAVIGAAGAIGSFVVKELLKFPIASLTLFDLSENNLVELVRDLRAAPLTIPKQFRALPIGLGSHEFDSFLK